ncbi:hypothetical protein M1771_02430 [Spiroplasma citri]|uniref:Transmembrane protein n=2 Tax=Spiroplasma citri TaxID=2133 RepID=A0AAX3T098_SPICI|nr:hypothetical protein [Spiroplasma citri]WFG96891.1 hypothetical protein M0C40_02435 [Spiroplasma citri]WFH00789.1 hypothetical protein M1771_02430 [Spiroplasma citri]
MKENSKKLWMINSTLFLMVTVFVSFILYVLYLGYLSPRPLELGTIVTNPNLPLKLMAYMFEKNSY